MSLRTRLTLALAVLASTACTTMQPSTPWGGTPPPACVAVERALPSAQLPSDAVPFPGAPYVLIPAESAVGLLVPVPFVTEMVAGAMDRHDASNYQGQLGALDPYQLARQALDQPPFAERCGADAPRLHPFVFVVEGHDGLYRLTLVFQLQKDPWVGRYHAHLPTPIPKGALRAGSPTLLATVQRELADGSRLLASLVSRDLQGRLPQHGPRVDAGSLWLVGGNVAGLVPPENLHFKGIELIEAQGDDLLLRSSGAMTAPGQSGALLFGVHHFRRDQLHHFTRQ